ncbi:Fc.00g057790.m01.CDS01 [Cosmosporella sp. VM-42]
MLFKALAISILVASGALAGPVKRQGHKRHHKKKPCSLVNLPSTKLDALPVENTASVSDSLSSVIVIPTASGPTAIPTSEPSSIIVSSSTENAEPTSTVAFSDTASGKGNELSSTATSTTSTAASSPAPAASGKGNTKRGVLVMNGDSDVRPFISYPKISWCVNDWNGAPDAIPNNWDFVPTMWNPQPDKWWDQNIAKAAEIGYKYVVGLSESDMSQPPFTPDQAVTHWRDHMEKAAELLIPAAPVIQDVDYLEEFWTKCEAAGCKFLDGNTPIGFNVYVSGDQDGLEHVKKIVDRIHTRWPTNPIWVQNIGHLAGSKGTLLDLINTLVPYLEAEPSVTRYAVTDPLLNGDGNLSEAGLRYATM